jgi:hypothetical protein
MLVFNWFSFTTRLVIEFTSNVSTSASAHTALDMLKRCNKQLVKITRWDLPEAQRFKNLIDTHFHYLNVWIAKAIMNAEMKFVCPRTMYDCLTYDGGVQANSIIILLRELDASQGVIDEIKASFIKDNKDGIKLVHSIEFEDDEVVLRYFRNLDTGIKTIPSTQFLETIERIANTIQEAETASSDDVSDDDRMETDSSASSEASQDLPVAPTPQLPKLGESFVDTKVRRNPSSCLFSRRLQKNPRLHRTQF